MRARAAVAAVCILLVTAACAGEPAGLDPTPTPSATTESTAEAASPSTPTAAPATAAAPAAPTPQPGIPFALEPFPVQTRFVAGDDPEGVGWPFAIDLGTLEVRRWVGAYAVTPSPFDDRVLATVAAERFAPGVTAILDLATGDVEGLLPVASSLLRWPEPTRLFLLIDPLTFGQPPTWLAGIYELDLEARTVELVSRGGGGRMLSPDATMTMGTSDNVPGTRIFVRDVASGREVYIYDPNYLAQADPIGVWSVIWLDDSRLALSLDGGRVVLADPRSGDEITYESGTEGLALAYPSPDGRLILATAFSGEYGSPEARADTTLLDADTLEAVAGPFENATPIRWSPDSRSLIMRGGACGPDGDWLEVLDVATGASRRVAPDLSGFWYIDVSLDGTRIAAGSRGDAVVIDVAAGEAQALPALGLSTDEPPIVFDFPRSLKFSATGRWLVAEVDPGSEGC